MALADFYINWQTKKTFGESGKNNINALLMILQKKTSENKEKLELLVVRN